MPRRKIVALCRYCFPTRSPGLVKCHHCEGWRNPNRKQNRRRNRRKPQEGGFKLK